ncbi:hypothetical protein ABZ408_37510 [Streptomyces tibetensis]|uniref:hypothetical protein n=1 Tax=Streptomyces tibetensis TaxID=2382123 RepID=UPI0033E9DFC7
MSTLVLLVVLLLAVVAVLLAGGAAYLVHCHPSRGQPLAAAFGAVTVMGTLVGVILARRAGAPGRDRGVRWSRFGRRAGAEQPAPAAAREVWTFSISFQPSPSG